MPHAVEIRVSDDGPGIPAEEVRNIFKHFYQSSNQKVRGQQGTGLGLAIARHIVEAHKGRIWAESEIGCGSTFHVVLPIRTDMDSNEQYSTLSKRAGQWVANQKFFAVRPSFVIFVLIAGCATSHIQPVQNSDPPPPPLFAPQTRDANRRLRRLFRRKLRSAQILPGPR